MGIDTKALIIAIEAYLKKKTVKERSKVLKSKKSFRTFVEEEVPEWDDDDDFDDIWDYFDDDDDDFDDDDD